MTCYPNDQMRSTPFVIGMLYQARIELRDCKWYEFKRKSYAKGFIKACEIVLKVEK